MTTEQIRIAIAETQGFKRWKAANTPIVHLRNPTPETAAYWVSCGDSITDQAINTHLNDKVPNYPEDLDAIHEVEKSLTEDEGTQYFSELETICQRDMLESGSKHWLCFLTLHATALQRCEAYLRVKGIWKEDR